MNDKRILHGCTEHECTIMTFDGACAYAHAIIWRNRGGAVVEPCWLELDRIAGGANVVHMSI